jgi:circadian clock protein KaiB
MDYVLKLYVTGKGSVSVQALVNIKRICEEDLAGRYDLEVIDVLKEPALAEQDEIEATPTLVRVRPLPMSRIVGDLSDREKIRARLGLVVRAEHSVSGS